MIQQTSLLAQITTPTIHLQFAELFNLPLMSYFKITPCQLLENSHVIDLETPTPIPTLKNWKHFVFKKKAIAIKSRNYSNIGLQIRAETKCTEDKWCQIKSWITRNYIASMRLHFHPTWTHTQYWTTHLLTNFRRGKVLISNSTLIFVWHSLQWPSWKINTHFVSFRKYTVHFFFFPFVCVIKMTNDTHFTYTRYFCFVSKTCSYVQYFV